jgi:hypothetical protein
MALRIAHALTGAAAAVSVILRFDVGHVATF